MGHVDAATLRAVLLAHAHTIAGTASTAPAGAIVRAVVGDDGRWQGAQVIVAGTVRPAEERETSEAFYVPAACRTAEEVRRFIDEYLSDWGDESSRLA
jgi:hypothetical protein